MVNREPWPGLVSMCSAPPSFLISVATTSMPTPRPDSVRHGARGREPGLEDQLHDVFVGELLVGTHQAQRDALVADGLEIHAGAVVGHFDHDLRAFAMQRDGDACRFRSCPSACALRATRCRAPPRCAACARRAASCARAPGGRVRPRRPRCRARPSCRVSVAAWRTMRASRCTWRWNGTMRVRMSPFCSSVIVRACCVQQVLRVLGERFQQLLNAAHVVGGLGECARELLDR